MALATAVISFDISDLVGAGFDASKVRAWTTTNADNNRLLDTAANLVRVGDGKATVNNDGTGSFDVWVPGPDGNPTSWQQSFIFEYPLPGARGRTQATFGPYTISGSANLADLEAQQAIPPTYLSEVTGALSGYVDDAADSAAAAAASAASAVDISGISTSDDVVEALVKGTAGAGPKTRGALATSIDARVGGAIVAPPAGFPTFSKDVTIRRFGSVFTCDYDMQADRPPAGATYYVAPGVGSAAGSIGAPTTPGDAIGKSDVGTIIVRGGEYFHDETFALIQKSVNIVAYPGEQPVLTGFWDPADLTWTLHSGSVYKATITGVGTHAVVDKRAERATSYGTAAVYAKKADVASVTAAGQWTQVGDVLYVRALGDANLATSSTFLRVSRNNAFTGIVFNANNIKVYAEGITFEGIGWSVGATVAGFGQFGGVTGYTLLCKGVTVRYATAAGAYPAGASFVAYQDCEFVSCIGDGIGYQSGGGFTCYFLEIDTVSHHHFDYDAAAETVNASTAHDACVGIRVNTKGYHTQGPIFADVSGTKVWNLGLDARESDSPSLQYDAGLVVLDSDSEAWYDTCFVDGVNLGLNPGNSAVAHAYGVRYGNTATNGDYPTAGGSIAAYNGAA